MKKVPLLFSFAICTILFHLFQTEVHAHNFYQNQDSMLFALVKQYEIEHGLASGNDHIYKSVALYHSENSAQLFKRIVWTHCF
jgi:hypothetical protein